MLGIAVGAELGTEVGLDDVKATGFGVVEGQLLHVTGQSS